MPSHSIFEHPDGTKWCSCGMRFSVFDPWGALRHALPLNIESLNDAIKADPNSDAELIRRSAELRERSE